MVPLIIVVLLVISAIVVPVNAAEEWINTPGFGPAYVSDTIPDQLLPGHAYPVFITFRNNGLVSWQDEMRRIGLLYEGDLTDVTAIPTFVELSKDLNITPGKTASFGLTLLPVGVPGSYNLSFSVVMRSAIGDQKITESYVKHIKIVPTDGISSPVNGSIYVESPLPDLKIFQNSVYVGNIPAIIADVKPGRYEIKAMNGTFERFFSVDVDRGTMTRIMVLDQRDPPVITKKKVGPVSDGTLIGYIEANIPLILIILLIIVVCIGLVIHGLRKRTQLEEEKSKKGKKKQKSDDPDENRLEEEKELLKKIHSKKPIFEGLTSSSIQDGISSGNPSVLTGSGVLKYHPGKLDKSSDKQGIKREISDDKKKGTLLTPTHDLDVNLQNLELKSGSATAFLGISNNSSVPVTVKNQDISAGGFGIVPVDLKEPVDDEPELTLRLRFLAGGSEFFKNISIPYNRGLALLARGVVEKGYEYFKNLLHNDPTNIQGLFYQAMILAKWGLEEESKAVFEEILKIDPSHTEALSELEKLNTKIQKRKENREIQIKPKIAGYPDELFDRYTPIRVLGDDPFATVILVRRNDTGDLRALKIPQNTADIRPSLYTEISLLYQLRHPYVLRMFRAEFSPVMFLELEYVAGARYEGTQRICLSDLPAPLPIDLWLPMIEQISEGLAYIHKQGVRHYHLSPKYILLDEPMTPKISGLIRESLRGAGSSGKEEFFVQAPEQIDPHFFGKTGKKTDIYQLGAIWFWLVTGKIFNHDTLIPESDWEKISFSRFDESLACYDPLLQNLTARFKNDRYSSVEFFLKDLHETSINQGIPMSNSFSDAV